MTQTSPQGQRMTVTAPAALESLVLGGALPEAPYLLLDLRAGTAETELAPILRALPCPVLGLADPARESALTAACDVVAASEAELGSAIAQIERAPLAAAVLVQVLRITAPMTAGEALIAESLAYATLQAGPEFARWKAERKPPAPSPSENGPPLLLDRQEDVLSVTLNRPRNRNAISVEMRDALIEAFALAAADDTIARLNISGAGACFSVGGDLAEFGLAPSPAEAHAIRMRRFPARALLPVAERASFHLHGACIGAGIELPAFAGRVTASADAFFQLPELRFGLIPGAGGCVSIPRRIGRQRMAALTLSGRRVSARTALSWGLIDEIV
jgi:Enoyl-CoA hydratase/isomerase